MDMLGMAGKMKENLTKIEMPEELEMLKGLTEKQPEEDEIETATDKDGKSSVKIPYDILINFIKVFEYTTCWDKFLLFIGTLFTFIHALCFLFFALLLDLVTEPFLREKDLGYGNKTEFKETDFFDSMNGTHLLTENEMIQLISEIGICYGGIGICVLIASFFQTLCWEWAAENQCCRIRDKLAVQILRQEMNMFETHSAGELGFKLINDVERVREGIGHKISMVLKHTIVCGVLISYGLYFHFELTIIFLTMAPLPLIVARYMYYGKNLAEQLKKEKKMYATANAKSTGILSNIRTIAAFAREDLEIDKYRVILGKAADFAIQNHRKHAVEISVFFLLLYGSYALAFEQGCKRLMEGSITQKELHRMFYGVTMTVFSVAHILPWISTISSAYGSKLVLSEILHSNPKIDASQDVGKRIRHLRGKLKFDNVSFAYESDKEKMVISNVTIEASGNQTIGIIGTGGAGKSTIVNLLMRLYDTTEGAIKIDDVDVKDLNVNWLRNHISIVPPAPVFRQETILKNILAGRNDIPFEQVVETAKLVDADDFIRSLPLGYETVIGVTGLEMARHERQRISITRALVRKPFWLVFDDALADLPDYNTVIEKIRKSRRGGATIILSVMTSVVKNSDLIYVLCDGKVVDSGKNDELLERKGAYYDMMKQEKKIPKYDLLKSPDEDPDLGGEISMQQTIELTPPPTFKYKGFWKMLKLVNRDSKDWHRWKIIILGCALTGLALPIFALFFINILATFGEEDPEVIKKESQIWTYFLIGIAVMNAVGYLLRAYHIRVGGEFAILRLRLFTCMSILRRPMSWFDKVENSPSSLCSRLASEVPHIKTALDNRFGICLSGFISFLSAVILSLVLSWQLGLVILASVPIFAILIFSQMKIQRRGQVSGMELMDYANALFTQAIQRIWTIQVFTQEEEICGNYRAKIKEDLKHRHSHCVTFALMNAISCSFVYFVFAATFQFGSQFIDLRVITPDTLYRVFLVVTFTLIAVGPTLAFIADITKAELSFARTLSLIEKEEKFEVYPKELDTTSPWIDGKVSFENVEFRYPNRRSKVLDGCTFTVPAGSTFGLTGAYGSGKTTSLALIQRFYEVDGGKILIDGEDIQGLNVGHLRTNIGYVPTEPNLFNRTIEANISYGYCGEVEGDGLRVLVQEAVEMVGLQRLMERYPDGYNTMIRKDGAGLSTIEKKKIAFARALIRTPRILLIDEPMVGLNANDEQEMLNLIKKIKVGRTCIVTTARAELLKQTDTVGVLQRGKIVEFGTPDELLTIPNGFYAALAHDDESGTLENAGTTAEIENTKAS